MAETVRKPKPIAGALWGVLLGLGLALLAINAKIIDLKLLPFLVVVLLGIVIGVLWGMFGPAKKPKGPAPVAAASPLEPSEPPAVEPDGVEPDAVEPDAVEPPRDSASGFPTDTAEGDAGAGPALDEPTQET